MVALGKSDVKVLNSHLKEYTDEMFGRTKKRKKTDKGTKDSLQENMKGFQSLFKEKVTFKPKVGKKLDKEMTNVNILDLIKAGDK